MERSMYQSEDSPQTLSLWHRLNRERVYQTLLFWCALFGCSMFAGTAGGTTWLEHQKLDIAIAFGVFAFISSVATCHMQYCYGRRQGVPKFNPDESTGEAVNYWGASLCGLGFLAILCFHTGSNLLLIGTFAFANAAAWYLGWRCR
jgi:hypothetical protein